MPSPPPDAAKRGVIAPIGGAEDKLKERAILSHFANLSGGRAGHICILPTASRLDDTGDTYRGLFKDLGVGELTVLNITNRGDASEERWLEALEHCTGVFMTGGDQLRLSTILGGTPVAQVIRRRNAVGCHVAGTSAGAAFVSEHMIAFGSSGGTPRVGNVTLAPGLGLTNRVIVDQHFRQRDRLGRLLSALSYNPFSIGIGLDEDTAAFIGADDVIEIKGAGAITIIDVGELEYSAMADTEEGNPVDLVGVRLHVLSEGSRYDLGARRAVPAHRVLQLVEE
jgi:cyanophycinase